MDTDEKIESYSEQEANHEHPAGGKRFPVLEIFGPTLQGEGSVIGMQTMFIRFGGCDYRCKMCDSLHAVLPRLIKQHATYMTAEEIMQKLGPMTGHCPMVTLSGGNPAMHQLDELIDLLHKCGLKIAVETQGTLWQDWIAKCDYITVSPKGPGMGEKFEPDKLRNFANMLRVHARLDAVHALKIVIFDQQDIEFAKMLAEEYGDYHMYLSLGNPYPPQPQVVGADQHIDHMAEKLLGRMNALWDDIKNEPLLANATFLPQMHVLLWANAQGV